MPEDHDHNPYINSFFQHAHFIAKRDDLVLENCIFDILKHLIGQSKDEIEYSQFVENIFHYANTTAQSHGLKYEDQITEIKKRVIGVICHMVDLLYKEGKNERAVSISNRLKQTANVDFDVIQ